MDNLERRLKFHKILCEALGSDNVYYEPPEGFRMKYPCIVYNRSKQKVDYANDHRYIHRNRYSVTIIDRDPDSSITDRIEELQFCSHDRDFSSDNLNHFSYTIYY